MVSPCLTLRAARFGAILALGVVSAGVGAAAAPALPIAASPIEPVMAFSTNGHTVYHLRTARRDAQGNRAIISAAYDGTVLAHTPDGRLLWERKANGYFPFDLAVADIDNDGRDEIFVATAGGTVDALSPDGRPLWSYTTEGRSILYQVCPVRTRSGEWRIFTGGIGEEILALSSVGKLVQRLPAGDVVRLMRKGNIRGDGQEYVAVTTTSSARSGTLSLLLIDPSDVKQLWRKTDLGQTSAGQARRRFFNMLVQDVNHDGADEILISGGNDENGIIYAFGPEGKNIFVKSDPRIPNISYRMNLLRHVKLPNDEFILGHFGNVLIVYERDGTCREVIQGTYAMADAWFDPALRTLFMGSSVSGGDGIYAFRLDQPGWQEKFKALKPVGNLAKVEGNIETLKTQLARFTPPAYQPPVRPATIISRRPAQDYPNVDFVDAVTFSQKIVSRQEVWCHEIDRRRPYNLTADEIVAAVKVREAAGKDFIIWAGHGTAVHFPLSTFERVIKAAPRHLTGFIFAEMESVDESMQKVVNEIIQPLGELCLASGKVMIFRNKNVFWNGSCYLPFWKKFFADERLRGVIIPGMEESNSRTQEMSLAGRVGLWQSGQFEHWLGRVTTDHANFDRMHEWGAQEVITHHLRNLVCSAANGADIFYNTLEIGDLAFEYEQDTSAQYEQLVPFYEMLAKGIIHIPRREELLSVPDVAVAFKSPPDRDYLQHGVNGHIYDFDPARNVPMVFDRLDCYWGAAPLLAHDFSAYGYGAERRMFNFLPKTPYGLVAIVPDDVTPKSFPRLKERLTTDGRWFYDAGRAVAPADYRGVALAKLEQSATRLPVRVQGDVAWSVVRLDPHHVRVTLIDSGYVDPRDRSAEIVLQHLDAISCTDILRGERLSLRNGRVQVTVPAGIFSVIDIEHR
jgi:outer membrane protein assembly factor BamB